MTSICIDFSCSSVCGLIIQQSTGVCWSNQTGGIQCLHPSCEGFYVPLEWGQSMGDYPFENEWRMAYDPIAVREWLLSVPELNEVLEARDSYDGEWGENWIPVRVRESITNRFDVLHSLRGRDAIVTMENSD